MSDSSKESPYKNAGNDVNDENNANIRSGVNNDAKKKYNTKQYFGYFHGMFIEYASYSDKMPRSYYS